MKIKTFFRFAMLALLLPLFRAIPLQAQGDKVLAQVADGIGSDGTQFITKLRIINLGPDPSTEIRQLKVLFFHQDGSPWTIATNWGTANQFSLDLGAYQTYALNTTGAASQLSGYAIVRDPADGQTIYAEDYQVSVTAFYEVRKGGSVIDTISVPVSQPTVSFVIPVETDTSSNLLTGFAIVNLANSSNAVTMQLFQAQPPPNSSASDGGTSTITLNPNEQRATFLYPTIFPGAGNFAGMLVGSSAKPVAMLALLQTNSPTGPLYSTMAPAYIDALRRNTYMYLREGYPLDADQPVVDYFFNNGDTTPWDLLFEYQTDTTRRLTPQGNAQVAALGLKADADFDGLTLQNLQGLTYTSNPIDMSDNSSNLAGTFAFAIKTGLGRYVKVRIAAVITRAPDKDLALEIFVFK